MKRLLSTVLLLTAPVFPCMSCDSGGARRSNPVEPEHPVFDMSVRMDDMQYDDTDDNQKYNIYLPAGRSADKTPVLFIIHGGGWASGSRNEYDVKAWHDTFFPGIAVVSMGYRFAPKYPFPAQEEDVKRCIEEVMANREEFGISNRIGLFGGSAGAHLAMLYAYKHSPDGPATVKVVGNWWGPGNMSAIFGQVNPIYLPGITQAVGGTPETKVAVCRESSPVNYLTATAPPSIMIYGGTDDLVPKVQGEELAARMEELGVEHKLTVYPEMWHGPDNEPLSKEIMQTTFDYIKEYLK